MTQEFTFLTSCQGMMRLLVQGPQGLKTTDLNNKENVLSLKQNAFSKGDSKVSLRHWLNQVLIDLAPLCSVILGISALTLTGSSQMPPDPGAPGILCRHDSGQ